MQFWKKRLQRVAAMVCSVALVASMMPTAAFATEPEPTPTPEPTSIVETTPTPEPSESPENTDATVTTPAPDADADSTAAPSEEPTETPDGTKEPVESPEPSGEPTDDTTESGEEGTETTDSTTVPGEEGTETTDSTTVPNAENVEQQVSVPQTLAAAPTADGEPEVQADDNEVYSYTGDSVAEKIYVGFEPADGPGLDRNITIVVKVDGEEKARKAFNDVYAIGSYLTIDAEMYDLDINNGGASVSSAGENKWLVTVGIASNWTITVNLNKRTTFDDIPMEEYGTFHWSKQHATTWDHERKVSVYVNEKFVYETTIQTPEILQNGSSSKQYWFTPNTEKYKTEYSMSPAITVDTVRNDIAVYLTTKCACGNPLCLCVGGCDCPSGCTCPDCTGESVRDNQINTEYGLITYKEPGLRGGYNLTVKIFVNGQEKFKSDEFRVYAGLPGNLKFEIRDGYYYHQPNGYDIDANSLGATWLYETSQLSFGGALSADREYHNVLSIYLWTFENYTSLDVQRMAGVSSDDITGYEISYTLDGVTYTYPATDIHDAAQPQTIPTGVDVTLTAICASPKIATEWECHQANATNILIDGSVGSDNQTKAYGNSATLRVTSVNDPRVVVYVGGVQDVTKPDDTTIRTVSGNGAVNVDCTKDVADHVKESYALESGSYTPDDKISGSSNKGYTFNVSVNNDPYVQKYVDKHGEHTLASAESDTMTLEYVQTYDANTEKVSGKWQMKEAAEFDVTCSDEGVDLTKSIVSVKRGETTLTGNDIPATFKVGDVVTYQVEVKNTGNVALSGLTITDTLTAQGDKPKSLADDSGEFAWKQEAGNWIGTVSNVELAAKETKTYKYTYTVVDADKGNTITNAATVNGDGDDPTDDGETETKVENHAVGVEKSLVQVKRGEEIFLAYKGTIPEQLEVGDELTYEIEVKNIGNVKLNGLTLTDTFNGHFAPSKVKDKVANVELTNEWEKDTTTGLWTLKIENISPDVGEIETYTYTYTVNQADADKNLTNTAAVTGDELDPDDPDDEGKDEHPVKDDGDITLQPADITIYMGGEDGYAGAAGGDSKSLPEPGFYITLPADVENALQDAGYSNGEAADLSGVITEVTATTTDGVARRWTMQKYGESASTAWINNQEHFVYRIVPGENQPAISVNFTNEDGTPVTEDKFTLTDSLSETYFMSLNTASVDVETISLTFNIKDQIFHCGYDAKNSQKGTLTVRYASEKHDTTKAVTSENDLNPDTFGVVVGSKQLFNINQKDAGADGVDVTAKDVSLLVDSLVGGEDYAYTSELYSKAVTAAGFKSSGVWGKYLDLVDAENGNAWLTPEGEVTVFWPYPAGVTKDTGTIKLYHFEGLDRDMATGDVMSEISKTEADEVPITRLDDGFTFNTSSFSPFVLVQDTTQPSGGEDKPTGGDDGNNDNNNNNTNTNNQTTTVNVANQAAAPAAAPAAAIPQTGDAMPVGLLGGLAAAAAAGFAALFVIRKRKQNG